MKNILKLAYRVLNQVINPIVLMRGISGYSWFIRDYLRYRSSLKDGKINLLDLYPCLHNKGSHDFDPHYFYMSIWAFQHITQSGIDHHVDVGSQLNFVGLLSSVIKVTFIDIRPVDIELKGFENKTGNILEIPFNDQSIKSLSSLHVAEHIGLGRYGDPIDPEGTIKAITELSRVLAPEGKLFFALPIGKPRICFNAHRIFDPMDIVRLFDNEGLSLFNFSAVGDDKKFAPVADPIAYKDSDYACGFFCFTR